MTLFEQNVSLFILPLFKTKFHCFHLDEVFYKLIICFSLLVLHVKTFVGYPCFDRRLRVAFIHVLQECTVCQKLENFSRQKGGMN